MDEAKTLRLLEGLKERMLSISESELEDSKALSVWLQEIDTKVSVDDRDEFRFVLVERLESLGLYNRAIYVMRQMEDWHADRVLILSRIAKDLFLKNLDDEAEAVLLWAAELACACPTRWQHAESLLNISKVYRKSKRRGKELELLEKAVEIARKGEESDGFQDSVDASSVLKEIAVRLHSGGWIKEGMATVRRIKNRRHRNLARKEIKNSGC